MTNNDSDFFRRRVQERTHGVWQVARPATSQPSAPVKHLLIICTANICRSPMVEGRISDHRVKQVNGQMLDQADLILVMEERHRTPTPRQGPALQRTDQRAR